MRFSMSPVSYGHLIMINYDQFRQNTSILSGDTKVKRFSQPHRHGQADCSMPPMTNSQQMHKNRTAAKYKVLCNQRYGLYRYTM